MLPGFYAAAVALLSLSGPLPLVPEFPESTPPAVTLPVGGDDPPHRRLSRRERRAWQRRVKRALGINQKRTVW